MGGTKVYFCTSSQRRKNGPWSIYLRIFTIVYVSLPCDSEVSVNLTALVGSTLIFPDPVKERAFLSFGSKTIASVTNGTLEIVEDLYLNRLHWNISGHLTLSDLQKSDSGVYTIDSKKGTVFNKLYEVKLYEPVSVPVVSCVENGTDSLSVQCSINKTEHTSLSWFRGDQLVESSPSGVLNLTVHQGDYYSEFKCVAENPADNKTTTVKISTVCGIIESQSETDNNSSAYISIVIAVLVLLSLLLCLWIFIRKRSFKRHSQPLQTQDSVQYAQINILKRNGKEPQSGLTPSGSSPRPDLTTVYDEIQLHRMTPTYSNCGEEIS